MAKAKVKADCRADTRGGPWCGLPACLISSAAYRSLSLHARAILIEVTSRMNGYNNGSIAVSQRELKASLGCHERRIIAGMAELMDRGMLDVTTDGQWKQRLARSYRLTFVSTKGAGATNDYLRWTPTPAKSGDASVAAEGGQSVASVAAEPPKPASSVAARLAQHRQKTVDPENLAAASVASLICKPYPGAEAEGSGTPAGNPPTAGGIRSDNVTVLSRVCERSGCGQAVNLKRSSYARPKRFCSERCRKADESRRRYLRGAVG